MCPPSFLAFNTDLGPRMSLATQVRRCGKPGAVALADVVSIVSPCRAVVADFGHYLVEFDIGDPAGRDGEEVYFTLRHQGLTSE